MFCSALLSILFKLCAYIIVVFMLLCLAICCTSCKGVPPIKLNVIAVCLKLCVVIFSLVIPMFRYDFFIISLMDLDSSNETDSELENKISNYSINNNSPNIFSSSNKNSALPQKSNPFPQRSISF